MSKRWWLAAAVLVIAVGLAVVLVSGGDTARDIGVPVGPADDPPFAIRLSGPLWDDRTLHDDEGSPDIALITGNERLRAAISGPRGAQIAAVELRVDGRVQRRVKPDCPGGRCPDALGLSFVPQLKSRTAGRRRVEIVVRDPAGLNAVAHTGEHLTVAALTVQVVPGLPTAVEAERPTLPLRAPPGAALAGPQRRAAMQIVADARRTGPLRALLGATSLHVRAAGTLRNGTDVVGATLFLQLPSPRVNVSATLPSYVPGKSQAGPYVPRAVHIRVATLRDVLVDVDLSRRRVIAVEPGPGSVTTSWSNVDTSAKEGLGSNVQTVVNAAARRLRLVNVSDAGPAVLAYDGDLGLSPHQRDWAVSLLFTGHATVGKVKHALRGAGYTRQGSRHYLAYRLPSAGVRFDSDRGLKTKCDAAATDVHLRFYAPAAVDHFQDPEFGSVVAATAHLDHADGCGTGTPRFGFSGVAERRVAASARRLGWRVQHNALLMGNAEPYRRDVRDPSHIWLGDGRATVIWVP